MKLAKSKHEVGSLGELIAHRIYSGLMIRRTQAQIFALNFEPMHAYMRYG